MVCLSLVCTHTMHRRWLDAAGPIPYKDGQQLGPILPRQRVLEHYESHVLRCPDCQNGLRELRSKQQAALVGGELLLEGGVCCFFWSADASGGGKTQAAHKSHRSASLRPQFQ